MGEAGGTKIFQLCAMRRGWTDKSARQSISVTTLLIPSTALYSRRERDIKTLWKPRRGRGGAGGPAGMQFRPPNWATCGASASFSVRLILKGIGTARTRFLRGRDRISHLEPRRPAA